MILTNRLQLSGAALLLLTALIPGSNASAEARLDAARQTSDQTGAVSPAGSSADQAGAGINAEIPKMEGDSEYGVQKILYKRSNWEPFSVKFDLGGYYTNNVALVDDGREEDFFLKSGLTLGYTPQITGGLFFSTSLSDQIFRYADTSVLDFDLFSFDAGFLYATPQAGTIYDPVFADLVSYVRYSFYRISEPWSLGDEIFDNHSVVAGLQKTWRISRGHQVYLGLNGDWSVEASREEPRRDEYSAYAGYRVKWTSELESNLLYRAAWYDYAENDRNDFNQVVSLSLEYRITDWLKASASLSAIFNNSDKNIYDYEALNTGVGLGLQMSW